MQTKNPTDPKSIQTLMTESTLGSVIRNAQMLDKIDRYLAEILTPDIRATTHVLNLRKNHLILASSSSSIATHLRYRKAEIIRKLGKISGLPEITHIECIVKPDH